MKTQFKSVMGKTTEAEQIKLFDFMTPELRLKMKSEMKKKMALMASLKTNIDDLKFLVGRL